MYKKTYKLYMYYVAKVLTSKAKLTKTLISKNQMLPQLFVHVTTIDGNV